MSMRGERRDPNNWEAQARERAYFLLLDGTYFRQEAMGGHPARYRQPVTHPSLVGVAPLHPTATHLEFFHVPLRVGPALDHLYLYARALRLDGPMNDDASWKAVP